MLPEDISSYCIGACTLFVNDDNDMITVTLQAYLGRHVLCRRPCRQYNRWHSRPSY